MNKRKNDLFLIIGVALVALVFFTAQKLGSSKGSAAMLTMTLNSEVIFEGELREDAKKTLEQAVIIDKELLGLDGDRIVFRDAEAYNEFELSVAEDGSLGIRCVEANCRDHICMDTGVTVSEDNPIVCLPHRLAVRVTRID